MDSVGEQRATGGDTALGEVRVPDREAQRDILSARVLITPLVIAANVVAFGLMATASNAVNGFNPLQLAAWGANSGLLDLSGQWWRLVTYQFLHANLVHVAINMFVLWTVGRVTERLYGRVAILFVYLAAGVIAGLASAVWNPFQITVGASGSIFGVVGAFIAIVPLRRDEIPGSTLRYLPIAVLFAAVNLYFGASQPAVDNAAHAGGLLAGLVIGAVMTVSGKTRRHTIARRAIITAAVSIGLALPPLWYLGAFQYRRTALQDFADTHAWYVRGERPNLQLWSNLGGQAASGAISNDALGHRFQYEILPFWSDATRRLQAEVSAEHGRGNPYVAAVADFAAARLTWARAVITAANDPTGADAQQALADIQKANLAQARLMRLEMRSAAERVPRPLVHSAFIVALMTPLRPYSWQCADSRHGRGENVSASDAANDGPALRHALGCDAQWMFMRGDYAELDAAMKKYSRAFSDLPDGSSSLEGLWGGLGDLFDSPQISVDEAVQRTNEWRRAVPGSTQPDMVEALAFRDWAYAARGNGFIATVSQQALQLFLMRSEMAAEDLRESAPAAVNNPLWYQLSIAVGRDQTVPPQNVRPIFDRGAARFPHYMPLYRQMLTTLMPRWQGSAADVNAFIVDASKRAGRGQIEPVMYARLYLMYGYLESDAFNVVADAEADPDIMKAGLGGLRRLYPHSDYILNEAAHYYCSTSDRVGYEAVQGLLKNHVSSPAWPDKLSIAACSVFL
jgi:membrane associated rhomboid family serine protease